MNSDTSSVWNFYARFRCETSSGVVKCWLFFLIIINLRTVAGVVRILETVMNQSLTGAFAVILVAVFQVNALHDFMRVTRESGNNNTT